MLSAEPSCTVDSEESIHRVRVCLQMLTVGTVPEEMLATLLELQLLHKRVGSFWVIVSASMACPLPEPRTLIPKA